MHVALMTTPDFDTCQCKMVNNLSQMSGKANNISLYKTLTSFFAFQWFICIWHSRSVSRALLRARSRSLSRRWLRRDSVPVSVSRPSRLLTALALRMKIKKKRFQNKKQDLENSCHFYNVKKTQGFCLRHRTQCGLSYAAVHDHQSQHTSVS